MLPADLTAESFAAWPPEAKALATKQLPLLERLPLAFLPLLMRELIVYDWKFPAERKDLDRQFAWLSGLSASQFQTATAAFSQLRLSRDLEKTDWVNKPAVFSEQLSAHLWATHQIDAFRAAAVDYVQKSTASAPDEPLPTHRLGIAIIGQGVKNNEYRLFRKLRPQGTYFTQVQHDQGVKTLLDAAAKRTQSYPAPYSHWYIDGGRPTAATALTTVTWFGLTPVRTTLQTRMQKIYEGASWDPEAFRTLLAQMRPADVGLNEAGLDANSSPLLNRFQLSLLTEGSAPGSTAHSGGALRPPPARAPHERTARRNPAFTGVGSRGITYRCRHGRLLHMAQPTASSRRGTIRLLSLVRRS
jgi:hypothetical protein